MFDLEIPDSLGTDDDHVQVVSGLELDIVQDVRIWGGDMFQGPDQIEFADQAPFPGLLCDAVYFQFGRDPERQLALPEGQ